MDHVDTYATAAGSATPPINSQQAQGQTLNEEVTQVMGQLGRFWGGFKKQSATAIESARKDFGGVVVQAQKELIKLSTTDTTATPVASTSATSTDEKSELDPTSELDAAPTAQTSTLFSRIQSSLPPNILSTLQSNLPESLKHASENIDLAQLRTTLTSEFQRVQGVTRAQAEEYVHKSEGLLREAMKEAGEVLRDAVKIVPPQEGETVNVGTSWDGTDFWMTPGPATPTATAPEETASTSEKGKSRDVSAPGSGRPSGEHQRAVATRAESLLKQLRQDPKVIRRDPQLDESDKELYDSWLASEVTSKEDGIEGSEWSLKCMAALAEGEDLNTTQETLVPSAMTKGVFWTRYFFRVHQIEREEEKRKTLLQGAAQTDDDFTWEDDEDEAAHSSSSSSAASSSSSSASASPATTTTTLPPARPQAPATAPATTPAPAAVEPPTSTPPKRDNSEEEFDLVSNGSTNISTTGDVAPSKPSGSKAAEKKEEDASSSEEESSEEGSEDQDSDWE